MGAKSILKKQMIEYVVTIQKKVTIHPYFEYCEY